MSVISAGTKFGLITVTGAPEPRRNGVYYECRCDCGAMRSYLDSMFDRLK